MLTSQNELEGFPSASVFWETGEGAGTISSLHFGMEFTSEIISTQTFFLRSLIIDTFLNRQTHHLELLDYRVFLGNYGRLSF